MISRDRASVLHISPVFPGGRSLAVAGVPDLLTPNDVHDAEALMVIHDPLSNSLALGVV